MSNMHTYQSNDMGNQDEIDSGEAKAVDESLQEDINGLSKDSFDRFESELLQNHQQQRKIVNIPEAVLEQENTQTSSTQLYTALDEELQAIQFIDDSDQIKAFNEFPVVVGRSVECDWVLPNKSVSRQHAKLSLQGDRIFIEDLGSLNGIRVNGYKVKEALLTQGDQIHLGHLHFRLRYPTTNRSKAIPPKAKANRGKKKWILSGISLCCLVIALWIWNLNDDVILRLTKLWHATKVSLSDTSPKEDVATTVIKPNKIVTLPSKKTLTEKDILNSTEQLTVDQLKGDISVINESIQETSLDKGTEKVTNQIVDQTSVTTSATEVDLSITQAVEPEGTTASNLNALQMKTQTQLQSQKILDTNSVPSSSQHEATKLLESGAATFGGINNNNDGVPEAISSNNTNTALASTSSLINSNAQFGPKPPKLAESTFSLSQAFASIPKEKLVQLKVPDKGNRMPERDNSTIILNNNIGQLPEGSPGSFFSPPESTILRPESEGGEFASPLDYAFVSDFLRDIYQKYLAGEMHSLLVQIEEIRRDYLISAKQTKQLLDWEQKLKKLLNLHQQADQAFQNGDRKLAFQFWQQFLAEEKRLLGNSKSIYSKNIKQRVIQEYLFRAETAEQNLDYHKAYSYREKASQLDQKNSGPSYTAFVQQQQVLEELFQHSLKLEQSDIGEAQKIWRQIMLQTPPDSKYHTKASAKLSWYMRWGNGDQVK